MANRNLELLTNVARLLRPMLGDLVFVGGCTTTLLITDTGAAEVRPTYDVDAMQKLLPTQSTKSFQNDCGSQRLSQTKVRERPYADGCMGTSAWT